MSSQSINVDSPSSQAIGGTQIDYYRAEKLLEGQLERFDDFDHIKLMAVNIVKFPNFY